MDLILNLKKKWFDMWKSGEKEREIIIDKPPTICIGEGKTEWGAEKGKKYYVIKKGI